VGTGWIANVDKKWLITNYHIVGDAKTVEVVFPQFRDRKLVSTRAEYLREFNRWKIDGRVLRRDPQRDLALVELASLPVGSQALPLAAKHGAPGDAVLIIGNRGDLEQRWVQTSGHLRQAFVSADGYPWRTEKLARGCRLLALQAPINEGDSGGPVLNERGDVVGVASAILWHAQKATTAIDATDVRAFLYPDAQPS